jgi:hypothetical protein
MIARPRLKGFLLLTVGMVASKHKQKYARRFVAFASIPRLVEQERTNLAESRPAPRPHLSHADLVVMQIALVHMPGHGLDLHFERVSKFGLVEVGSAGGGLSDALRDGQLKRHKIGECNN